jgi:hypothetical protein
MRIPIVAYPQIVEESLKYFGPVFQSPEQCKHFCEYVTGLIAGDRGTVQAINSLFLDRNDQSALNKFLTRAEWDEIEMNRLRVQFELARLYRRPVSARAGRLLIDDTLNQHQKGAIEGLAYLKDHSVNRYVWAHDVVTAHYLNRQDQFPVDFRPYHQFRVKYENKRMKEAAQALTAEEDMLAHRQHIVDWLSYHIRQQLYQPKTRLAIELIQEAIKWGLPFSVVLWDSWYTRRPLIEAVEKADKDWVGGCPKDRNILYEGRWQAIEEFSQRLGEDNYRPLKINDRLYWFFAKNLKTEFLNRRKLRFVLVYDTDLKLSKVPLFFTSNRLDWDAKRILTTYFDRWPTETLNQDVKGNLHFANTQLRRWRAIKRHWYLSFVAYSLLGDLGPPGRSRWAVRGRFQSTGQRCQMVVDELLGYLVYWVVQQVQGGQSPDLILQQLLT